MEAKPKKSRSKDPGVRVQGGRIYDSRNGKTCHQCRQKTMDFAASCMNQKGNKQCSLCYCRKCLKNRYGENAEEVVSSNEWKCPKCRDLCNCSFCMKKRGYQPTGILAHTAKVNGFTSVSELLHVKGPENFGSSPKKPASSKKELVVNSPIKHGKENSCDGKGDNSLHLENSAPNCNDKKAKKTKKVGLKEVSNGKRMVDININSTNGGKKRKINHEKSGSSAVSKDARKNVGEENTLIDKKDCKSPVKDVKHESKVDGNDNKASLGKVKISGKADRNRKDVAEDIDAKVANGSKKPTLGSVSQETLKNSLNDHFDTEFKTIANSIGIMNCTPVLPKKQIELPPGTSLTTVAGIELPTDAVGDALQFFEFSVGFAKALDLKKGQAEAVIRETVNGRRARHIQSSLLIRFHIQLLSLVQEDAGIESPTLSLSNGKSPWLHALGECVAKCQFMSKEFPPEWFNKGNEGYTDLTCSKKLKLLNFLCDEALNTSQLRSWIDDEKSKSHKRTEEAKEKINVAKEKEKNLKQKLQDEIAKAMVAQSKSLSVSEHAALVAKIKSQAAQAHEELLDTINLLPRKRKRCDAVRTDPIHLDADGRIFWRLKGYNEKPDALLQDIGTWSIVPTTECWIVYKAEQRKKIEKYLSYLSKEEVKARKMMKATSIENAELGPNGSSTCHERTPQRQLGIENAEICPNGASSCHETTPAWYRKC